MKIKLMKTLYYFFTFLLGGVFLLNDLVDFIHDKLVIFINFVVNKLASFLVRLEDKYGFDISDLE